MTTEQTAQQLELAAQILRTGHPWGYRHIAGSRYKYNTPIEVVADGNFLSPLLATPPDNRPLHNPGNLTAEQVGVGYRLALPGEKLDANYDYWLFAGGWKKGHGTGVASELNPGAAMRLPLSVPWPEPADPYAELKAAHAAGKVIECRCSNHVNPKYHEWGEHGFKGEVFQSVWDYRIKPEEPAFQLPPPPPGMRWHREDGWKEGDLPSGYRPLAKGEQSQPGDEHWAFGDGPWKSIPYAGGTYDSGMAVRCRTTRPLTFNHAGKTWTWHRLGDPMPCDGDSSVNILCRDEQCFAPSRSLLAKNVDWDECYLDGFDVLGWRYAEPQTKTVPLGPEDVPPGSVLSRLEDARFDADLPGEWSSVINTDARKGCLLSGFDARGNPFLLLESWERLMKSSRINRSIPLTGKWNPDAWEPCSKLKPLLP